MKKILAVLAVAALAGVGTIATATNADAQHYHHRHRGGSGIAPLLGGLAAGAIIGGAIATSRPGYAYPPGYYAPGYAPGYAPAPVEYDEPVCTLQPQNYWDGYGWRTRTVQVCN
jgi:hypothetical protein